MAMIVHRCLGHEAVRSCREEMTFEEFKRWIFTFDADKDGRISKEELGEAVRVMGGHFASWKGRRGVKSADSNGNGFIDHDEISKLVAFAEKELQLKIVGSD